MFRAIVLTSVFILLGFSNVINGNPLGVNGISHEKDLLEAPPQPQPLPNSTTTVNPITSSQPPTTSTRAPTTTTRAPNTTTHAPNTTTHAPTTTSTTSITTTSSSSTTTDKPLTTTTKPSTSTTTTQVTTTSSSTTTSSPHPPPPAPSDRKFDAFSFLGGFALGLGLVAIGILSWKFYLSRQENYYHTL